MKSALFVLFLWAVPGFAQTPAPVSTAGVISAASTDCSVANSCITLPISPNDNGTTIQIVGTIGTVQFEATADGSNWVAITGSPVTAGAGVTSATAAGMWQANTAGMLGLRVRASVCSSCSVGVFLQASAATPDDSSVTIGSGTITVNQGTAGTAPWPVTLTNSALVSDYAGTGATVSTLVLSSGSTVMTAATVDVQEIRCNNFTASTVFITMTDTAGNLFTGEATAKLGFAIPAYAEDYPIASGSHIKMVGIKMYAGTASAVNCVIYGKQ